MKNFIEWCKERGLPLATEGCHKEPVKKGKKVADPNKYSGAVRKTTSDLSKDYKGHMGHNGTVDPYELKVGKGKGKPIADVAD